MHGSGAGLETTGQIVKGYFIRRLLLIPPTLIGITLIVFGITRFVPGGPMDRMLQEASRGADQGGKRSSSTQAQGGLSEELRKTRKSIEVVLMSRRKYPTFEITGGEGRGGGGGCAEKKKENLV